MVRLGYPKIQNIFVKNANRIGNWPPKGLPQEDLFDSHFKGLAFGCYLVGSFESAKVGESIFASDRGRVGVPGFVPQVENRFGCGLFAPVCGNNATVLHPMAIVPESP